MTLDELIHGQQADVVSVQAAGSLGQRLLDFGFIPGSRVEIVRNAPLVDPIELRLEGMFISLRHSEARCVTVQPR